MAFATTHIKIAIALKDKYYIREMDKYLSGVIYPDSRYITGVDWALTHDEIKLPPQNKRDDFIKGWSVHIRTDQELDKLLLKFFPEYLDNKDITEFYHSISALKTVLDFYDYKNFNIFPYIDFLTYAFNPNGESLDILNKYYADHRKIYKNSVFTSLDDYRDPIRLFNIPETIIDKFIKRASKHYNNRSEMKKIEKVTRLIIAKLLDE